MKPNNPFAQFLGPQPGDLPPYQQPEGAKPFEAPELSVVTHTRLELAKRQARMHEGESK